MKSEDNVGYHPSLKYTTDSVISKDGTSIGYRQYGQGPGVVLVQGAMGFAENFSNLAEILAESFTVYVPDRRGRGMSPCPYHPNYSIQRDIEDLRALLNKTGTVNVFALSSGAVIALAAAMSSLNITKLAVFEPPLFEGRPLPHKDLDRFQQSIRQGNIAAAMTAAGKAVNPAIKHIPNWLLNFMMNRILAGEAKKTDGSGPALRDMALSLQYDFHVIAEMHEMPKRWDAVKSSVILLGGEKSPPFLKLDLDTLEEVLPDAKRVTFPKLGHSASWNYDRQRNPDGNPERVALELHPFFIS